ncbi:hypothetical protein QQZ08_007165 [Neonectria magnoliae]|uniref:Yeast cell wall synthesis Kre9/Knh1-like N-terminal domain-containing protein n=1 Tax=Neonectria magnoliae TaxID=2732573 RepID=A0ABR1I014_9HYPO
MQFSISAAAVLAFVASAFAQTADFDAVNAPTAWEVLPAGSTFKIEWQAPPKYDGKTISISLIGGATQGTQVPLINIASGIKNEAAAYEWAIPASLGDAAVYGLVLKLESNPEIFQYSNPFKIDGDAAVKTTKAAADATTKAPYAVPTEVKTISLSSAPAVDYTKVVEVTDVTTVPCTTSVVPIIPTSVPVVPNNATTPAPYVPVTSVIPHGNATWSTAVVPPATTGPSNPAVPTPETTVVTGAGARFGAGSAALVGGLLVAVFAL